MKSQSINIKQYNLLFEILEQSKQIIYNSKHHENISNNIIYLENLIKEFDAET